MHKHAALYLAVAETLHTLRVVTHVKGNETRSCNDHSSMLLQAQGLSDSILGRQNGCRVPSQVWYCDRMGGSWRFVHVSNVTPQHAVYLSIKCNLLHCLACAVGLVTFFATNWMLALLLQSLPMALMSRNVYAEKRTIAAISAKVA